MNLNKHVYLAVSLLVLGTFSDSHAASSIKFADELAQRGQFQAASIEYQRALVDQADLTNSTAMEIAEKALQALWLSRDFKASSELADFYARKHGHRQDMACISNYYAGLSFYGMRAYPRSSSELAKSLQTCPEPYLSRSQYWTGLAALRMIDFDQARNSFEVISASSPIRGQSQKALKSVLTAEMMPRKSSKRAGFLNAVLPGSGYAYAGYPQTGVASFLTTGLFTWGTVAAVQKGETALAILLGSLNVAWYFGGVQGAANAAQRTNDSRLNAVIKPLEIN